MIRKIFLVLLLISFVCVCAQAADISGKWKGSLVTPGGIKSYVYEFKVEGNTLTGQAILNGKPTPILDGKVNGDQISFSEDGVFNGNPVKVTYSGTVQGDKIKFQRKFADFPPDTMTIKRAN
jgi:hypothetical protein